MDAGRLLDSPYTFPVRIFCLALRRFVVLAGVLGFWPACVQAENDPDPAALLRVAVDKFNPEKQSTRFVYLDLSRTQQFDESGALKVDRLQTFEMTYINDVPYEHLVERDGWLLEGKELEAEVQRYDAAMQERAELDGDARAKMQQQWMMRNPAAELSVLPTEYRNVVMSHTTQQGRDCLLIDSTALPGGSHTHYRVWLDPAAQEILRVDFIRLADQGQKLQRATGTMTWTYIEGVPLMVSSHADEFVTVDGKKPARVVVDHRYSRFSKLSETSSAVAAGAKVE
jgi:hypothetical protein